MKIPSSQRQPLNKTNQGGGAMEEMSFSGETEWGGFAFSEMERHENCCIFAD